MPRANSEKQLEKVAAMPGQRKLCASVALESTDSAKKRIPKRDHATQTEICDTSTIDLTSGFPSWYDKDALVNEVLGLVMDQIVEKVIINVKTNTVPKRQTRKKALQTNLVGKRRCYDSHERAAIMKTMDKAASLKKAVMEVRQKTGFTSFGRSTAKRMRHMHPLKRRGRKINHEFETAVLDSLMYTVLEKEKDLSPERLVVLANICHSHRVIQKAASVAAALPQFADDPHVSKLKFTRPWIAGWLKRNVLRRRRTTTAQKNLPPVEEVRSRMRDIQAAITTGGYGLHNTFNADETGIFYAAGPTHQYVPDDADRASRPESDEKVRFTSMEAGAADGKMTPSMHIIKCQSKNGNDLSRTTVISSMHKLPGFRTQDGWELKTWTKTLQLQRRKKDVAETYSATFICPYIQHKERLTLITCQNRAWMDTPGVAMWAELLLGPYVQRELGGKALLIWDNCGPHNVPALKELFQQIKVETWNLPSKMTDRLQVMDLVVNAPLKSGIRSHRYAHRRIQHI